MRKMLAGFLATSMIVAVASATTFAASATATIGVSTQGKIDSAAGTVTPGSTAVLGDSWTAVVNYDSVDITMPNVDGGTTITVPISKEITYKGTATCATPGTTKFTYTAINLPAADVVDALNGKTFNVTVNDYRYSGKLKKSGSQIVLSFDQNNAAIDMTGVSARVNATLGTVTGATVDGVADTVTAALTAPVLSATGTSGTGSAFTDVETSGTFKDNNIGVQQVVVTDGEGNPIPLTEKQIGADKDLNDQGGVQSGTTLYFMLRDDGPLAKLADDNFWKLKITKGDNGKYIKAVSDVTKIFSSNLYNAYTGIQEPGTGDGKRHRYIKIEMNEIYTDDEYKMSLDLRLSAKSAAVDANIATDDSEIKVKDFYFWMKNIVKPADNDWKVGIGGLMLNPLENDWNEVTYYDEDGDLAFMKFFGDSDVGKFYAKLSTKWEHADYASYFNDQDAFIFNFTGSPKLSSTSRADLQIYNPFIDDDGNETIDPATATIYQVIDGDLFDVTDSFKYEEGDNGDMAFVTRTRFLGTYIICEKPVEEAAADETVPDTELTPDDNAGAPEETTPDNNGGGKAPANTGKYL